jgi:hypothetical protein
MNKNAMDKKMYEAFHSDFGLKAEWLGKEVEHNGKTYTITGLNPRSKKFPVITNNGETLFSAPLVVALMTNSLEKYEKQRKDARQKEKEQKLKDWRANFSQWAQAYGVPKTWLGRTFKHGRTVYTIVGLDTKRKYPVVVQTNDGRFKLVATESVKGLLGEQAA